MPAPVPNLNLRRRALPGILAVSAAIPSRPILSLFRRKAAPEAPLWAFSSYMVGDLFMALPALKKLGAAGPLRVLCRPDCAEILRREGLDPVPFDNAFFVRGSLSAFLRTWRSAWSLRSLPVSAALDLDADPRTAFWMRVAGVPRVVSFRRPYGALFDAAFDLPVDAIHQADKDMAVVEMYLGGRGRGAGSRERGAARDNAIRDSGAGIPPEVSPRSSLPAPRDKESSAKSLPWLLSVWTRKAEKNWPLARWENFMGRMVAGGIPFAVLEPPDGDAEFRAFRERWRGRAEFVAGPLEFVAERAKESAGVVATDNFLGHMGGYHGKPVLWINVCSPAAQVEPRGPRTSRVGDGAPGRPILPSVEEAWRKFLELN